jgi:cell division FtsZ-interacting protein ZapD
VSSLKVWEHQADDTRMIDASVITAIGAALTSLATASSVVIRAIREQPHNIAVNNQPGVP